MTNHWVDIRNANLILSMGGNSAEAHPVGFRWVTEAIEHNKAKLICIDPRYTRTCAVADYKAFIRTGTDITFLGGLIHYLITTDQVQHEYVLNYTDASLIVHDDYGFEDGIFTGYNPDQHSYDDKSSWMYKLGDDGYALRDTSLQHPRCVYQLMREHYSRYDIDTVSSICGMPREHIEHIWAEIGKMAVPHKTMTMLYALGWTQHSIGSQIIRTAAMVQLLLGNMGMPGGGVNALRGHSNIQGLTDLGLLSQLLPGYMSLANAAEQDYPAYIKKRAKQPILEGEVSYWKNYEKFHVSLMKSWFGDAANEDNNWCFNWLPKLSRPLYDVLDTFDRMYKGEINGYFCQGFNPLASFPNRQKVTEGLSRLKYLVVMDPLNTETSEFWKNYGEYNDVDSSQIQTEVIRLPTTCFAEDDGSIVNSARWLQWHWAAAPGPGEARPDTRIMGDLFIRIRELYRQEGGVFPDPILNLKWDYNIPEAPSSEELAQEYNGRALVDLTDDNGNVTRRAGELLSSFSEMTADGRTASGCWIFSGAWTQDGNQMARRDNSDPYGTGNTLGWAWAWPANRRVLYNRASADTQGRPWGREKAFVWWSSEQGRWIGADVPDFPLTSAPSEGVGPFIMQPSGGGNFFAGQSMVDGPFPEHYEPFESPIDNNPLHPNNPLARNNPAGRIFDKDRADLGTREEFPHAATTYRLTEHFHYWTKHARLNAVVQPEQFVEISHQLAEEIGVVAGDWVRVSSNRGFIKAVAVVTKRMQPMRIGDRDVHHVGIPIHWGFTGVAKKGYLANALTPVVGDANTQTPEYKSFIVKVEKA